ncbi:MAG: hydrogenase formation protein HypD [Candidatus Omnitrophica bacterium]|nr:hydrogenase formation protein HypD [Candidatus Omnitrophota bacterium]MDD5352493.1 hydrogenase formation protein HypD [Candidatus Omnitrophota bacterium]MDD5550091.1 hydrogenase formation protein HypD [Candidatus Omnitrophota bacterium]
MKPIQVNEQFKDVKIARILLERINLNKDEFSFMEVCGTHTVQIFKTGIRTGLNSNIKLLSGPGCPVCVTSVRDIDKAITIAGSKDFILCCFGDMLRVPGTSLSLEKAKGELAANVKIMYSPIEALELAEKSPSKKIVMFGVGFETTIPAFAAVLIRAREKKLKNLYIYSVFKLIPPAIRTLLESKYINIDGFILPGHVSTIIGSGEYRFIAEEFQKPAVITGFEVVDILEGILFLSDMARNKQAQIKIEYSRSVNPEGNKLAMEKIYSVFEKTDVEWRGLGKIRQSGLKLRGAFRDFDIDNVLDIKLKSPEENPQCICGDVIKGMSTPLDCKLYAKECTPENPVGPCMVSSEGTCAAFYKYGAKS